MTEEYTPSMDDVRDAYIEGRRWSSSEASPAEVFMASAAEFDRALAAYTVEVQANTLREAASEFYVLGGTGGRLQPAVRNILEARADSLHPEEGK